MIRIAAPNTPSRLKKHADVICDGPTVHDQLQAAADAAWPSWDVREELVLYPGVYPIANTLRIKCAIRGTGNTRLKWVGEDDAQWMVIFEGAGDSPGFKNFSGVWLNGNHKASGLLVRDVHRSVVSDVYCHQTYGGGLRCEKAWCLFVRNFACRHGTPPAFEMVGRGSILDGFSSSHMRGDAPIVDVRGGIDLRQVGIEDSDTGDSPVVLIHGSRCAQLSGFNSENLKAPVIIQVSDTFGAGVERLSCWQEADMPIPVVVRVEKSAGVKVEQICAWNVERSIVEFDADSYQGNSRAMHIQEGYELKGRPGVGVQPRHLIDYGWRGRDCKKE